METRRQNDIPPSLAVVLLGAVLAVLWVSRQGSLRDFDLAGVEQFLTRNDGALTFGAVALLLNLVWFLNYLSTLFGLNRQGSKLHRLMGERAPKRPFAPLKVALAASIGLATFLGAYFKDLGVLLGPVPYVSTADLVWANRFIQLNLAVTAALAASLISPVLLSRTWGNRTRTLPRFPAPANGIVLGSAGEATPEEANPGTAPSWVVLNRRALNGNILMTGSIGGGKSQGTILPYFDQIIRNFSPRPAILAIDPKGTLLEEAEAIAKTRGLGEHILFMKLGGEVRFNPIWEPDSLRRGKFTNIAQMLRAAAVNYMGKPFDDPFWEESASNLIRNALVFCAAKYGYYTLNDLYEAMVRANDKDIAPELNEMLGTKSFCYEELFNIHKAQQYFSEEFSALESRVRTSILATSTSFLNQFREYQASEIFCPPQDRLTLPSLDRVVDDGKILLFGITSPGLARSMGTFVKLHYQQSLLNRFNERTRDRSRTGVLIVDEYQDFVSTGGGSLIGDNSFLAKGREANTLSIMATQSLISLFNAVGKEASVQELIQNFRTRIAAHSSDLKTIHHFQELVGKKDFRRTSHSFGEVSQQPKLNLLHGGFDSDQANLSESVTVSDYREYAVTGAHLSALPTFECFAQVFDGIRTTFLKLFLKPYYLQDKRTPHVKILEALSKAASVAIVVGSLLAGPASAFPNVCTVISTSQANSCIGFGVSSCMCGFPPRPCARFSYYLPQTFLEVHPNRRESFFSDLPGAALQLASAGSAVPFGAESDLYSQTFQAHAASVPFQSMAQQVLPCRGYTADKLCFDAMSEHLGSNWTTGAADSFQPKFRAGGLNPAACVTAGAVTSAAGGSAEPPRPGAPTCSFDHSYLPAYPPCEHAPCNSWGLFYPRSGAVTGPSQTVGALMVASRIKSLSTEVFQATPRSPDEKWQMISPQSSSCFREGENVASLEAMKGVREERRLVTGKFRGHLFVIWKRYSCCRDVAEVGPAYAALEALKLSCAGIGAI